MSLQLSQGTGVFARVSWLAFAHAKCKAIQLAMERRSFERQLASIVQGANAHHAGGRSPGDRQFKVLQEQADQLCASFTERWSISPELLDAQIPAITKLRFLAHPVPKPKPALLIVLGTIGVALVFLLLGALAGLTSAGYHFAGGR